ncbi:MAG: hypothetical protein ACOY33_12875 [Pseudomonadota bacterium]
MAQFEEDEAPAAEENEESVPDTRFNAAAANREAVARRRRIEEVVEGKRSRKYAGDYDFDLDK